MLDAFGERQGVAHGTTGSAPGRPQAAKRPVLIVVHQAHSNPGHVGQWFRRNGFPIQLCRHYDGDPLPQTLESYCGAVIFGGPQSANDKIDFIRREIDWLKVPLRENKPFLGICLGGQMLAHHLGARVDHCCHGTVEIGYHRVKTTEAGQNFGPLPERVFQWHREGFDVPTGARLLATSDGAYPHQAFSYGPAFGLQFHPEITFAQVNRWSGGNPMRMLLRGAMPRQTQMEAHLMEAPRVYHWLDQFLHRWVLGQIANA